MSSSRIACLVFALVLAISGGATPTVSAGEETGERWEASLDLSIADRLLELALERGQMPDPQEQWLTLTALSKKLPTPFR